MCGWGEGRAPYNLQGVSLPRGVQPARPGALGFYPVCDLQFCLKSGEAAVHSVVQMPLHLHQAGGCQVLLDMLPMGSVQKGGWP